MLKDVERRVKEVVDDMTGRVSLGSDHNNMMVLHLLCFLAMPKRMVPF